MEAKRDAADGFSEIYAQLYGRVYAYAARRVGVAAAEEVAAETFLIAWRRFDAMPAEPLPWLYGVARNVVLRHRTATARDRATERALELDPPPGEPNDTEDERLWAAWRQLSARDREVLALVAWEELSVAEAARVLGCPAPVFSVRLHRARRRLERLLRSAADRPRAACNVTEAS